MFQCPQCSSKKLYKDGLRYLKDGSHIQRYLCRVCGHRFSETLNTLSSKGSIWQVGAAPSPRRVKNLVKVEQLEEKRAAGATKKTPEEIKPLVESGFEYVTEREGLIYFRKRK